MNASVYAPHVKFAPSEDHGSRSSTESEEEGLEDEAARMDSAQIHSKRQFTRMPTRARAAPPQAPSFNDKQQSVADNVSGLMDLGQKMKTEEDEAARLLEAANRLSAPSPGQVLPSVDSLVEGFAAVTEAALAGVASWINSWSTGRRR